MKKPRRCKGAFGKTSGRSIFPNAPLRATSSSTRRSMSDAISNILSTCIYRTPGRVGFARGGKLLLKITNIGNISLPFESNSAYAGRCHTTTDLGKVPRVSAHFDRLCVIAYARMTGVAPPWSKKRRSEHDGERDWLGRSDSVSAIIQRRNLATMRP